MMAPRVTAPRVMAPRVMAPRVVGRCDEELVLPLGAQEHVARIGIVRSCGHSALVAIQALVWSAVRMLPTG